MEITRYQGCYFDNLIAMLQSQDHTGIEDIEPNSIPDIGYVATEGSIFIAMGFLRLVEGGFCQIDGLTSNKDLPGNMRHAALNEVISALIDKAKLLKLKGIISYTRDKTVISRAEAIGFQVIPYNVLSLRLE